MGKEKLIRVSGYIYKWGNTFGGIEKKLNRSELEEFINDSKGCKLPVFPYSPDVRALLETPPIHNAIGFGELDYDDIGIRLNCDIIRTVMSSHLYEISFEDIKDTMNIGLCCWGDCSTSSEYVEGAYIYGAILNNQPTYHTYKLDSVSWKE